ncbi:hypothetical protein FSP39_015622 [Pinctada imbricata]|uniref:FAD-dependent oxidoreductase domain-containing protein 2 n=1 Tax=Pinctada imbricata TaxID=66713 RepID=A0AA88XS93_PINIB|nr:hypothetical protein FSP39_015622 [Pinctada imbricata]
MYWSVFPWPYLVTTVVFVFHFTTSSFPHHHDYCVIGAGPSGLQIGYFLHQKHRDYVIFERNNVSGSFYVQYPRHRKLISINKRHTGSTNKEFNLRHDWNSLLSHDESLLFKHYSKEMFPHADTLVKYLQDFTTKLGLNVQYNTEVRDIHRPPANHSTDQNLYHMNDLNGNHYTCSKLIVATGIAEPNVPDIVPGIDYAVGYEDVSINPDDFEGQSVLVLGRGNAAFETADAIYGSTNLIHMVSRSRIRLAWETHYVGDLRAVNNGLLDTYQLKSQDAILEAGLEEIHIVKRNNKLYVEFDTDDDVDDTLLDNFALRQPYDKIIRCLGFKFDQTIFKNTTKLSMGLGRRRKYPKIGYNYESVDNPDMFFAGTNTHSLDFRKSAGGFIHGFRYTARSLHNLLEWRYHQVPWPSHTAPITQLINTIIKRLNEASGTYQMFGVLGDVIILKNNGVEFEILEEFPVNLIHKLSETTGHDASRIIVINMEYGKGFSGPGKDIFRPDRATQEPSDAHVSNFLHPVLYYYNRLPTEEDMRRATPGDVLPRPTLLHHIVEDFLALWDAPNSHILPLRRFLEGAVGKDLREVFAEICLGLALTHEALPHSCKEHFMQGQGLMPTYYLRRQVEMIQS